jgi:glutamine---fructose-6-phosphate transaminase (isomerizing)
MDTHGNYQLIKAVGKVSNLSAKIGGSTQISPTPSLSRGESFCYGIAHTRRATHGGVTEVNAHPHIDTNERFFVAHNGIIENQHKLKQELIAEGYAFYGETDTEVVPALLAKHRNGNFLQTVETVLPLLTGSSGFLMMCKDAPGEMIAFKWGSPIILGLNKESNEFYFSSDAQALSGYAKEIVHLHDGELVYIKDGEYVIKAESQVIEKATKIFDINAMEADKGKYSHFMLKEIYEQSAIINRICRGRVDFANYHLEADSFHGMQDEHYEHIVLVGCGTSYNACMLGAYWIEQLANIPAKAEIASEYIHKRIPTDPKTLHIFLSQSGETADSIAVLKHIKERGGKTFGIVNVVGSTMAHLTDSGLFMRAGFEIGVASSKAFTAQLTCLFLLTLFLANRRGLPMSQLHHLIDELKEIPTKIDTILAQSDVLEQYGKELSIYTDMFFLARAWQFPIACEGSLKMKEISYIHSEAYPAGELKHGPLALIEETVPSIVICVDDEFKAHNLSSIAEVQARKGKIFAISNEDIPNANWNFIIPETHSLLAPFLSTIVTQLLSFHTANALGREIDKPRNLAKSVTVK